MSEPSIIDEWDRLRNQMIRTCPDAFSRQEWAYLLSFLDPDTLKLFHASALEGWGSDVTPRLRGSVALWLPNNVSLLGPLMLIALSLTGVTLRVKAGSRSEDLAAAFLDYLSETLPAGALRTWLQEKVTLQAFASSDPRSAEMAAEAAVRIVFGSDPAGRAIEALPHPLHSSQINFTHRESEAWCLGTPSEQDLDTLIQVLAIYGQAGCTSPSRLVLLDVPVRVAEASASALATRWFSMISEAPAPHIASNTMMASQWARANGWSSHTADSHAAIFAAGDFTLPFFACDMGLPVIAASTEEALSRIPAKAQTLGCCGDSLSAELREQLLKSPFTRIVPLAQMHHFAPVWDGHAFLRELYEGFTLAP